MPLAQVDASVVASWISMDFAAGLESVLIFVQPSSVLKKHRSGGFVLFKTANTKSQQAMPMPKQQPRVMSGFRPNVDVPMDAAGQNNTVYVLDDDSIIKFCKYLAPGPADDEQDYSLIALGRTSKRFRVLAHGRLIWKEVCRRRWEDKHCFNERWGFNSRSNYGCNNYYWYHRYAAEEVDAKRTRISSSELHGLTFSLKTWFGARNGYPPGAMFAAKAMRSGINGNPLSEAVKFLPSGVIANSDLTPQGSGRVTYYYHDEQDTKINIYEQRNLDEGNDKSINFHRTFYIVRTKKWGWELRSNAFVFRSDRRNAWWTFCRWLVGRLHQLFDH